MAKKSKSNMMKNQKVLIAVAVVLVAIAGYFIYESMNKSGSGGGGGGNGPGGSPGTSPSPVGPPPAQTFVCPYAGQKGRRGGCMANPNCMLANHSCTGKSCLCVNRVLGPEIDCSTFNGKEGTCKANQGQCEWSNGYSGNYPGYPGVNKSTCMTRSESVVPGFEFLE